MGFCAERSLRLGAIAWVWVVPDAYSKPAATATQPTIVTHAPGPVRASTPMMNITPERELSTWLNEHTIDPK